MNTRLKFGMASVGAMIAALTSGCVSTAPDDGVNGIVSNTAKQATQVQEFGNGPAMWRLADADSEIYLFGTFHLLPADLDWTTMSFNDAMLETETTYTEADTTSPEALQEVQAAVQKYGINPPGVTLSSTLGPERAAEFAKVAGNYGLSMAQLEPLRPWLAVLSLTQIAFQQAGYSPQAGAEATVLARAAQQMDEVGYFESAVSQIAAIASLDSIGEFANTDESIEMLLDFDGFADLMLELWKTGDVAGLEKEIVSSVRSESEEAFEIIFKNRNANWVEQIDVMMKGEGDYFLAVGAGHLVGADSVVDMLRKRGYTVERVQ